MPFAPILKERVVLDFSQWRPTASRAISITGDTFVIDKPDKPEQVAPAKITITDTGIAPCIFFEGAVTFGFANGIVNVTLAASRHLMKDGTPVSDLVAVAHLRCNAVAALDLRNALDNALLLAAKTEGRAH